MTRNLNFVEGEGISIQAGPNPGDPDVLDIEIGDGATRRRRRRPADGRWLAPGLVPWMMA